MLREVILIKKVNFLLSFVLFCLINDYSRMQTMTQTYDLSSEASDYLFEDFQDLKG